MVESSTAPSALPLPVRSDLDDNTTEKILGSLPDLTKDIVKLNSTGENFSFWVEGVEDSYRNITRRCFIFTDVSTLRTNEELVLLNTIKSTIHPELWSTVRTFQTVEEIYQHLNYFFGSHKRADQLATWRSLIEAKFDHQGQLSLQSFFHDMQKKLDELEKSGFTFNRDSILSMIFQLNLPNGEGAPFENLSKILDKKSSENDNISSNDILSVANLELKKYQIKSHKPKKNQISAETKNVVEVDSSESSEMEGNEPVSIDDIEAFVEKELPKPKEDVLELGKYSWKITRYTAAQQSQESEPFNIGGLKWKISLWPYGDSEKSRQNGAASVFISCVDCKNGTEDEPLLAQVSLVMSNPFDHTCYIQRNFIRRFSHDSCSRGYPEFERLSRLFNSHGSRTKPIIEGDQTNVTAFIQILEDI